MTGTFTLMDRETLARVARKISGYATSDKNPYIKVALFRYMKAIIS